MVRAHNNHDHYILLVMVSSFVCHAEVYEDHIASSAPYSQVAHTSPDELLVVVDGNSSLSLHANVFPFSNREIRIPKGKGWAYVYNALVPLADIAGRDGLGEKFASVGWFLQ